MRRIIVMFVLTSLSKNGRVIESEPVIACSETFDMIEGFEALLKIVILDDTSD